MVNRDTSFNHVPDSDGDNKGGATYDLEALYVTKYGESTTTDVYDAELSSGDDDEPDDAGAKPVLLRHHRMDDETGYMDVMPDRGPAGGLPGAVPDTPPAQLFSAGVRSRQEGASTRSRRFSVLDLTGHSDNTRGKIPHLEGLVSNCRVHDATWR